MAVSNFIPSVWGARLLENLHKVQVYGQPPVINRDYEGDISAQGDTVRINAIGPVTVYDYAKNSDINAPEQLTDAQTVLVIEKQKYFNFAIDDVDRFQGKPELMDGAMREAAYALADGVDQYIAGLYTQAASANQLGSTGSPKTISAATDAYNHLVDLKVLLDSANVPLAERYVVIPPWYHGWLLKDERFIKTGTAAGDRIRANGEIGEAAGFRVLLSNNVPVVSTDKYKVMAGYPGAITFAEQVNKLEAYRPEKRFADAMKGLLLYGSRVVRPNGIAVMTVQKA